MIKMLNKIFSDKEYMEQGFSAEEVPLIRRFDILHNLGNEKTEEEIKEYYELATALDL